MSLTPHTLIPCPSSVTSGEGEFLLRNSSRIEAPEALMHEAGYLAVYLRKVTGFPIPIGIFDRATQTIAAIRLCLDSGYARLGKEG